MATQCPACDFEFRDALSALLVELNEKFDSLRNQGLSASDYERLSIDVIRKFAIPHIREELLDVLIYIQPKALDKESAVRDAWSVRQREVIERAKMAFENSPKTMMVIKRYEEELDKYEKQTIRRFWRRLPLLVKSLIVVSVLFLILLLAPEKDTSKEAYAIRFNKAVEKGQVDKALKYISECPEMGPSISTDYTALIIMLLDQDRVIEAESLYKKMPYFTSSTTDKSAIRAANRRFLTYYIDKGDLDHAQAYATDAESLSQLIRIFLDRSDIKSALSIYKRNTTKLVKYDVVQKKRVVLTDDDVVANFIKANTYGLK